MDRQALASALLELLQGAAAPKASPRLSDVLAGYLAAQRVHVVPAHADLTARRLSALVEDLGARARAVGRRLEYAADLDSGDLSRWMRDRLDAGAAPSTVRQIVGALKTAVAWAVEQGTVERSPIARVRLPAVGRARQTMPRARPTGEQIAALIEAAQAQDRARLYPTSKGAKVAKAPQFPLLWTLIRTGARRGELIAAIRDDYRRDDQLLRLRAETTKTRRERLIPLDDQDCGVIDGMLATIGERMGRLPADAPLFLGPAGSRLDPRNVTRWVHALIREARIERINARGERLCLHSLRHAAGDALAATNLRAAQLLLGHASLKTTEGYLHDDAALGLLRGAMAGRKTHDTRPVSGDTEAPRRAPGGVSEGNRTPDPQNHNPVPIGRQLPCPVGGSPATLEVPWIPPGAVLVIPTRAALLGLIRAEGALLELLRRGPVTIKGAPRE